MIGCCFVSLCQPQRSREAIYRYIYKVRKANWTSKKIKCVPFFAVSHATGARESEKGGMQKCYVKSSVYLVEKPSSFYRCPLFPLLSMYVDSPWEVEGFCNVPNSTTNVLREILRISRRKANQFLQVSTFFTPSYNCSYKDADKRNCYQTSSSKYPFAITRYYES